MIDLKLDTHAVRQLFPEGSAMRVQLQQSVINNIVKESVLKDSDNKIREAVQSEVSLLGSRIPNVNAEVKSQLESLFTKRGWNKVDGTLQLDRQMREEAARIAENAVKDAITIMVEEASKKLERRIEDTIKMTEHRFEEMIVSRINANFGVIIDTVIAKRLSAAFPEVGK